MAMDINSPWMTCNIAEISHGAVLRRKTLFSPPLPASLSQYISKQDRSIIHQKSLFAEGDDSHEGD